MTNPTQHGQVPEALIDLIDACAETRHRYGGIHNARLNMLDTLDRRNVFRAGFDRGFDRGWNAALAAQGGKV